MKNEQEPIRWITMNGNHVPIYEGQTEEEAINAFIGNDYEKELLKQREYKTYWLYDTTKEDYENSLHGAHGVSKYEYDKALKEGKEGYIKEYNLRIPEDIEEKIQNAINSIKDVKNWGDFENQIKHAIWGNGVNLDNFDVIMNAFDEELNAKYNELIQPKIDVINKIDIDNATEIFGNKVNEMNLSPEFKQTLNNMFDECKDENIKIMIATSLHLGLNIKKDALDIDNKKLGTCYYPINGFINFIDDNLDAESLAHETYHYIYDKYKINKSGLKEILKEEFNKNVLKQIENDFGVRKYIQDVYGDSGKEFLDVLDKENKLRIEKDRAYRELQKADKEYEEMRQKSFNLYIEGKDNSHLKEQLNSLRQKWEESSRNYNFKLNIWNQQKRYANSLKEDAAYKFQKKYHNLADMIEATQISMVDSTPFGFGHGKSYWKKSNENQSDEFFAEMAEMIAIGDKEQYELIRKYIPKTVAKFEELYNSINKNKGKVLER